jgi:hypothetical protein
LPWKLLNLASHQLFLSGAAGIEPATDIPLTLANTALERRKVREMNYRYAEGADGINSVRLCMCINVYQCSSTTYVGIGAKFLRKIRHDARGQITPDNAADQDVSIKRLVSWTDLL